MENLFVDGAFNWTVAWSFLCCILLVTASVASLFIRDTREKQKLYNLFEEHVGESIIVLSPKLEFLYGLPLFSSDPFYVTLCQERLLENFLPAADWIRMSAYFKDADKHPDMPFVLMYDDGGESPIWYEMHCVKKYYSSVEFHYVCFIRNISKEVEARKRREESENKLKVFLDGTGDFLWKFDIENRKLTVLTQSTTEEYGIVPLPMGEVDLTTLVPPDDYEMILDRLNKEILRFHETGDYQNTELNMKIRGIRSGNALIWYSVRCKFDMTPEGRFYCRGVARRMDYMIDNSVFRSGDERDAMFAAVMSLSDIRMFWIDRNFVLLGCNQSFAVDVNVQSSVELVGTPIGRIFMKKQTSILLKKVNDVFELKTSVAWRDSFLRPGQYIVFNAVPVSTENGLVQKVMCVYSLLNQNDVEFEKKIENI